MIIPFFTNRAPDGTIIQRHITANNFIGYEKLDLRIQDANLIPTAKYVSARISAYLNSPQYKAASDAEEYYNTHNITIDKKQRGWYTRTGQFVPSKQNNSKIQHPIFRTIVNKKANIALAKPILVNASDDKVGASLSKYFDKKFSQKLCSLAKKAYVFGKDWLLAEYDANNKLCFRMVDSTQVIDTWSDTDHDDLHNLTEIIWFGHLEYIQENGTLLSQKFARVYRNGLIYLYKSDAGFETLTFKEVKPIMQVEGKTESWETLPWIPFTAYMDELSLIKPLRHMIDAYDETSSDDHDLLRDVPNVVHVFKGYAEDDPETATKRIHETRTVFLTTDGSYTTVKPEINLEESERHLTRLNNDIYDSASAVDSSKIALGTISGIAIKLRYQDAIFDAQELCTCFGTSLDMLVPFILMDLKIKGEAIAEDVTMDYVFNLDLAIDETEVIDNLKNSENILSKETILENHPYVKDAKMEQARIDKESEEEVQQPPVLQEKVNVEKAANTDTTVEESI
jgi:SPP1 family phage portal protein